MEEQVDAAQVVLILVGMAPLAFVACCLAITIYRYFSGEFYRREEVRTLKEAKRCQEVCHKLAEMPESAVAEGLHYMFSSDRIDLSQGVDELCAELVMDHTHLANKFRVVNS